ncbi:SPOR domain-containing protein [Mariprofundus ferrooxydans]|uniref:SPOR domain-containing protein n=1 Tax=Mariprofundus ferrooxydans PV-1 TaxID=314345 RepID=Q0F0B7_9PROT|nr:SPOR domain-containing protein [Mariprofundus ferrooxydans]EAU55111.1 hypothetical protein SPV1_07199 [Mariprofundus ferrooxydans PV-1]KON46851.1 hypothetical protein AL013_10685 [Mariprofundus ferrooxydans]
MPEHTYWQASQTEQRTAWVIVTCCIITVMVASFRPQWFDFSQLLTTTTPVQNDSSDLPAVPQPATIDLPEPTPTPPVVAAPSPSPAHTPVAKPTTRPTSRSKTITTQAATPARSEPGAGYYVQLGAFKESARAKGLTARLSHLGWQSHIIVRGSLHAVWAGPTTTRAQAEQLQKAIAAKLHNQGFIIRQQAR